VSSGPKLTEAKRDWKQLEDAIGYRFANPDFLIRALTHRSHIEESSRGAADTSNEQMEFLGDAILGYLASVALVNRFPEYREGTLSKMKAYLVSAAHLLPVAQRLGIGDFLLLGKGEEQSGGRKKRALLVDALEALVAAVYLDGGLRAAESFVHHCIFNGVDWNHVPVVDYKSELQEYLQERHSPPPKYVVVREAGPEHEKVFTVQLQIGPDRVAQAEGHTKKAAEQAAAQMGLNLLQENSLEREQ